MADLSALIAQLRAAAEDATKGEWRAEQRTLKHVVVFGSHRRPALSIVYGDSGDNIPNYGTEPEARANAAYIVAAQPQNILRLLGAYAEMERALAETKADLVEAHCELVKCARARAALQQKDKADE